MPETIVERPTSPGWYWMRGFGDSPWIIVRVVEVRGKLCTRDPYGDRKHPVDVNDPSWGVIEWIGPIVVGDVAELDRLRAAGDVLADTAKQAAWDLNGPDHATTRDRLCNTIADWLQARMGIGNPKGNPCE